MTWNITSEIKEKLNHKNRLMKDGHFKEIGSLAGRITKDIY